MYAGLIFYSVIFSNKNFRVSIWGSRGVLRRPLRSGRPEARRLRQRWRWRRCGWPLLRCLIWLLWGRGRSGWSRRRRPLRPKMHNFLKNPWKCGLKVYRFIFSRNLGRLRWVGLAGRLRGRRSLCSWPRCNIRDRLTCTSGLPLGLWRRCPRGRRGRGRWWRRPLLIWWDYIYY